MNGYYDLSIRPSGIYFAEGPMEADCTTLEPEYHRLDVAGTLARRQAVPGDRDPLLPDVHHLLGPDGRIRRGPGHVTRRTRCPAGCRPHSPERFCQFINSVPPDQASHVLSTAVSYGAGWVFATDGVVPNPWGALPSYFDEELAAVRQLQ